MSSKTKTTSMKEAGKPALTPKLRFPEFYNSDDWRRDTLGGVCEVLNNRRRPITGSDRKAGPYPYYGASGIVDFVDEYIFDERLLLVGEDGAKWGAFEKTAFIVDGKFWVNNHAHVLKANDVKITLLKNYLTMANLGSYVTGAAPPKLTLGKLKDIPVPVPPSDTEQQKIAECLSSVDEVIAAQAQKLDALKTHKKGLMQQLFPREGETQPRLRFPEFREAGEWSEKSFEKIIKINSGKGFKASEYSKTGIRLLQIENVGYGVIKWNENTIYLPEAYTAEHPKLVLRNGDIVLALNRPVTNDELKIAKIKEDDAPAILYQRVGKLIVLDDSLRVDFAFHICRQFIKDYVINKSIGSDQPFISLRDLYAQNILIPLPSEQQEIADCLTSLDDLATAQAQKLEALKNHKKGLMQQLFPTPEETP